MAFRWFLEHKAVTDYSNVGNHTKGVSTTFAWWSSSFRFGI
ncbi:hypothetical protein COLO4_10678 [Corchorus olitorius]|uniref:Uncharacterized protein n=1 Tax=Corchorus olitorius TaxID=93759 RepID=A0A1R3K7A3_9ROSI|nr:hypothetical protein COLO4_10678 [Corchorus olitorius]